MSKGSSGPPSRGFRGSVHTDLLSPGTNTSQFQPPIPVRPSIALAEQELDPLASRVPQHAGPVGNGFEGPEALELAENDPVDRGSASKWAFLDKVPKGTS